MPPPSSVRQLLAGHTLHIAAIAVAGLLAPLGACGGEVSAGNGAGGDGAGGSGAGGGGGGAGGYGAGGAQQCPSTNEYTDIRVTLSDGFLYFGCSKETSAPSLILEGVVRNVAADTIVVDSCHPNANCKSMENVITRSGTDPSVSIPDGTFIQVHLYTYTGSDPDGCMLHVLVFNLPVWGGTPNPTSDGTFLWLANHYGFDSPYTLSDDPFQTERELACEGESMGFPKVYTWRFSFPDAPGAEVIAPQGQTVTWSVPEGQHAGQYRVRNVKAVNETHREDNYWIARK